MKRIVFLLLIFCWGSRFVWASEEAFLESLAEHGFFRLAEVYCQEQLAKEGISEEKQLRLTAELLRVGAQQALLAPDSQQPAWWERLQRTYTETSRQFSESPWQVLLDYQWSVALLARSQQLWILSPPSEPGKEAEVSSDFRTFLRQAIRILKEAEISLQSVSSTPFQTSSKNLAEMKSWQKISLLHQVRFQLLQAWKFQGETYPPESADRLQALGQALEMIPLLSGAWEGSLQKWIILVEEITCYRLLGEMEKAWRRIEVLEELSLPPSFASDLQAEKLRYWLDKKNYAAIREFLKTHLREKRVGENANWDYALLEVTLAFWQESLKKPPLETSETWVREKDVRTLLEQIRQKNSPWWVRKSEILFAVTIHRMTREGTLTGNLPMQVWRAEQACRSGDLEKALAACEEAWQTAEKERDRDSAWQVGRWIAAMLCTEKKWADAARWFQKMSVAFPEEPDSVKNHALAIQLVEKWVDETLETAHFENRSQEVENALDRYQELLVEHYQLFAEKDEEIGKILNKLEKLTRIRQKKAARVDVAMILVARTQGDAYQDALTTAVEAWDDYLRTFPRDNSEMLMKTVQKAILWSEKQTLPPREFLVTLGWQLEFFPKTAPQVEQKLRPRLQHEQWDAETEISGKIHLIWAMVLQGKKEMATEELRKITDTSEQSTALLLAILEKTKDRGKENLSESAQKQWATLEWEILSRLDEQKMSAKMQTELLLQKARVLRILEKQEEAYRLYEYLAVQFPHRRDVQTEWGRLLVNEGIRRQDKKKLEQALVQWREIESRSKKGTDAWFEAKYQIARTYVALDNEEKGIQSVKMLRVLYPQMGGEKWKKKFENILQ
ncbi:MAG: hypothetical protein Q4D62_05700 [Planctomycetia bacterium]|nr:hypothetical protein [Planctomycetia bacterium]